MPKKSFDAFAQFALWFIAMLLWWERRRPAPGPHVERASDSEVRKLLHRFRERWLVSHNEAEWLLEILGEFDGVELPGGTKDSPVQFFVAIQGDKRGHDLRERVKLLSSFCKCFKVEAAEQSCPFHSFEEEVLQLAQVVSNNWSSTAAYLAARDQGIPEIPFVGPLLTIIENRRIVKERAHEADPPFSL